MENIVLNILLPARITKLLLPVVNLDFLDFHLKKT